VTLVATSAVAPAASTAGCFHSGTVVCVAGTPGVGAGAPSGAGAPLVAPASWPSLGVVLGSKKTLIPRPRARKP
jgi:hypothetical protein